jgi:hypothetical protein
VFTSPLRSTNRQRCAKLARFVSIALGAFLLMRVTGRSQPETDAYAHRSGMTWTLGTARVEQTISLDNGRLVLNSFRNKSSGREYRDSGSPPSELRFEADGQGVDFPSWRWTFVRDNVQRLPGGEVELDVTLKGGPLEVTRHWVAYAQTGIIRSWTDIRNVSQKPVNIRNVFFLNTRVLGADADRLELNYITGGGNFNGSQLLKTERVEPTRSRTFDSYVGVQKGAYSAYLPLLLLHNPGNPEFFAAGWDYMGHWSLEVGSKTGDPVQVALRISGYDSALAPGSDIETPKTFTAAFSGDLDDVGNQLLDWQYRYFWDATNPNYFAKTRWAVDWPSPWVGNGGTPSADNWGRRLALDLRYVDLLREAGGDILWDDAGWYDHWGSWNAPDWRRTTAYLQKHSMRWVLWFPTFLATPESAVAQQHPGWILPAELTFEQSIPATASWQKDLLDRSVAQWQNFQWRYDIAPAVSATDTGALAADQNFRGLIRDFKNSHPESGVDACDGGGRWISYDLARLAESGEYTDGGVGPYSGYYTSLLVPPDKYHNVSDFDHTYYNPASDRIHLALDPTWYRDPGDGPDVESIRKDWELYHYFTAQSVVGRWSHIFRPPVSNDDPIWYTQRMNAAGSKGVIITKHAKTGPEYFLISKPMSNTSGDRYEGGPTQMPAFFTTNAAAPDTGIYSDPIDGSYRYYGVPGEAYGPLNFRYRSSQSEQTYITQIVRHGVAEHVTDKFFGMAIQTGRQALTISELGQYDPGNNHGTYSLMLVRASDKVILGSATLDMAAGHVDTLGFKYAKLDRAITIDPVPHQPVTVFPRGLQPEANYDVRTYYSKLRLQESGSDLMRKGISLPSILPGELIFLNLPNYPGSGTDKTPPEAPGNVTQRPASNLGARGVEVAWSAARDNNWVSYYEILKNGSVVARSAKGTFYFDHSSGARAEPQGVYAVRTVDGDGNRSSAAVAQKAPGDPDTYEALGDFGPSQGGNNWTYEESSDGETYRALEWQNGGYEGFWAGSGLGRIGRIWMQPSAATDLSRTFRAPARGSLTISGEFQKDPSAEQNLLAYVRILHNNRQIWPAAEWAAVSAFGAPPARYELRDIDVHRGDAIRFTIKHNGENRSEPIIWDPSITFRKAAE